MGAYTGHTVVNGELRFASVSAVKLYDPRTKGGCPRRWHSRYVQGKREPESDYVTEAKEAGTALDKEVKNFLRTGEKALSALATKGLHILEPPGPNLWLDVAMHQVDYYLDGAPWRLPGYDYIDPIEGPLPADRMPKRVQIQISSALTASGVPFVGELDILNTRGRYRDDDGQYYDDPPGTVEVADLKRKSNAKDRQGNSTFLLETDLVRDIQMAGYGEWVGRVIPGVTNVRLSHLYFPAKGALPTKVTRLHVLDDCRRTWEYVETVVRDMKDVARETDIEKVPGNTSACDAFSGCPHRETCSAYRRNSLDKTYGYIAADFKGSDMGLLAPGNTIMQPTAPAAAPNMQAQLAQEEAAMRAQAAQQQAQMSQNSAQLAEVCTRLGGYGFGFPALGGNAAQAYAVLGGQAVAPGYVFQGIAAPPGARRSLHTVQLNEVAHIFQIEGELAAERAQMTPQPTQQYAPVAPPANAPQVTQQITQAYNQAVAAQGQMVPSYTAPTQPVSFLPPGAPESMPQLAGQAPKAQTADGTPAVASTAEPEKKASRGRPKKAQDAAPEAAAASVAQATPTQASAPATQAPPGAVSTFVQRDTYSLDAHTDTTIILINARGTGPSKSLNDYVDYINAELSKRYCVTADGKPGVQDVRCAPKDSILAFGGWKGAVREVVKSGAGLDGLQGMTLHLDTRMDELNEAVADALRVVAEQRGWFYFRGGSW